MKEYIRPFGSINESVKQNGIVLIKGKPKGKNRDQMLYAAHVNSCAEVRPGATMLFLSDQFYRIRKDDTKLKGVRINWKDEDSLKAVLNFKSPGKLSVVRNNNKTPYHWKTLKHTNISDALNSVEKDIFGDDYLFESADPGQSIEETVAIDALDAILKDGTNVVVLNWEIPNDSIQDAISSESANRSEDVEWEASFDCIYVGRPELDTQLKEKELRRFEITIYFNSEVEFTKTYFPGSYDSPPDEDIEVDSIETQISSIQLVGQESTDFEEDFDFSQIVSEMDDHDLESLVKKKHVKFI
jgi:hypothetical protein